MKIKNLDSFFKEVQTIEIRSVPVQGNIPIMSLEHYDQSTSNYEADTAEIRRLALTVILLLSKEQIQFTVNRLQLINEKLTDFWKFYSEQFKKYRENEFSTDEFIYYLGGYFTLNIPKNGIHTSSMGRVNDFLVNLHDAVMFKQGGVKYILYEIKSITNILPNLTGTNEERAEQEPQVTNGKLSYKWLDNDLDKFYESLKGKYIIDTELEDFKAAFEEKTIGSFKPIKWHDTNATELVYFIKNLISSGLVLAQTTRMNYQRLKGCFVKSDGSQFTESLKDLNQQAEMALDQQKQEAIKSLLSDFL